MSDVVKKWVIRKVKLADVKPMPENARTIFDSALAALEYSIGRFGYVEPIVWNETTGHIVGGHQRFLILKQCGVKEANMVVVNLSVEKELAANLTLNNPKIEGTWDDPIGELLDRVEEADSGLFSSLNMDGLRETLDRKSSESSDAPSGIDLEKGDTLCPCCGYRWDIGGDDISVEGETS